MTPPVLAVQTVVTGEMGEFGERRLAQWATCLESSLDEALRRQLIGRAVVTVGVTSGLRGFIAPSTSSYERHVEWLAPGCSTLAGQSQLLAKAPGDLVLVADVAACLAPGAIAALVEALSAPDVGLVEPRRIPCQSLKPYRPETGEVSWASSSCCLIRRSVIEAVGGLDWERYTSAGAEIDFSWRVRLAGFGVRHVRGASVHLPTTDPLGESGLWDRVAVKEDRLELAARYLSSAVAEAWARGWVLSGAPAEQEAARRFSERVAAGRVSESLVGSADEMVTELFAFDALERSHSGTAAVDERVLVRAFGLERGVERAPEQSHPLLSVIVRTQGRRLAPLEDNLLSLVCQTCDDFEVVVVGHELDADRRAGVLQLVGRFPPAFAARVRLAEVSGGGRARPLNLGVAEARGRFVAFLDDDDVAFPTWVEAFRDVAVAHPRAVAWTAVAWQTADEWRALEPPQLYAEEFNVLEHLRVNGTPICGVAVPVECFRDEGLTFREDLPVFEDWDMVLRAAQLRSFRSTDRMTALYRRGSPDSSGVSHGPDEWEETERRIKWELDEGVFVLRGEYLAQLRQDLDELDRRRSGEWFEPDTTIPADPSDAGSQKGAVDQTSSNGRPPLGSVANRDVLVVSTHLDDAVLSCGDLIGQLWRCRVLTVFAGEDTDWSELTVWDEASGFGPGTNVVEARIAEDDEALAMLGASGLRLSFLDSQYREAWIAPPVDELAKELAEAIDGSRPEVVLFPLGIGHVDHRLTSLAAAAVARSEPSIQWIAYQDLPYPREMGGMDEALERLSDLDPRPVELCDERGVDRKGPALDCYASQTAPLGERRRAIAIEGPERYWWLARAGGGDPSPSSPG